MAFNKRKIEHICTFIAFYLLLFMIILWILYRADSYFNWDIIPQAIQQFIEGFLISSAAGIIIFTMTISLLLNISLISVSIEKIAESTNNVVKDDGLKISVNNKIKLRLLISIIILILTILGFNFYDKIVASNRINSIIDKCISSTNLNAIDSLINKLNYNDSLVYIYDKSYGNSYLKQNDSALGNTNINTYKFLKSKSADIAEMIDIDDQTYVNAALFVYFNNKWLNIDYSTSIIEDNNGTTVAIPDANNFPNFIYRNKMDNIKNFTKNGYKIYYKTINSKSFDVLIMLKTKTGAFLNFKYSF